MNGRRLGGKDGVDEYIEGEKGNTEGEKGKREVGEEVMAETRGS